MERGLAVLVAVIAVSLEVMVAASGRAGWGWLVATALVLVGLWLLARNVRARLSADAWRPPVFWIAHLAATTSTVTAITAGFGPPRGVEAVAAGLIAGPVLSLLAFATHPRVAVSSLLD